MLYTYIVGLSLLPIPAAFVKTLPIRSKPVGMIDSVEEKKCYHTNILSNRWQYRTERQVKETTNYLWSLLWIKHSD